MPTLEQINAALAKHSGNKTAAARELGIPRTTLRCMIGSQQQQDIPRRHLVIPDVQAKDGVPLDHLEWIGRYIADKRPDVIVCIGDFADMPSCRPTTPVKIL